MTAIEIKKQILVYSYLRFSTPSQLEGDSQRRQLKRSRDWCEKNDAKLVDEMQDHGLSAFRGKNRMLGVLGRFLDLVKLGEIPTGTFLIVENIDRLSREKVLQALRLYMDIIEAGITIVTLVDEQVHSADSIELNPMVLQMAIASMCRANGESERKSELIGEAWAESRRLALAGKPFPMGRPPEWLERDGEGGYKVRKEKASAVALVFELFAGGMSTNEITVKLNTEGFPALTDRSKTGKWRVSSTEMILHNKSPMGTIVVKEPYLVEEKDDEGRIRKVTKMRKIGEREDFYPAIVDKDTWAKVQSIIRNRKKSTRKTGGNRPSPHNAFSGLAKEKDGGGVEYLGHKTKLASGKVVHYEYLRAGRTFDCGMGHKSFSWHYRDFEELFLATCRLAMKAKAKTTAEEKKLIAFEERIVKAKDERDGYLKGLGEAKEGHGFLAGQVDEKTKEILDLEEKAESSRLEIRNAKTSADAIPKKPESRVALRRLLKANVREMWIDFDVREFFVELYSGISYLVRVDQNNHIFVTTDDFEIPPNAFADVRIRQKWHYRRRHYRSTEGSSQEREQVA